MKTRNKLTLMLYTIIMFVAFNVKAQTKIGYLYDANGNRFNRQLVVDDGGGGNPNGKVASTPEENKQIAMQLGLSVFPNPAQNKINVTINNLSAEQAATVTLVDETGKTLFTQNNAQEQNQIDMFNYKPGVYFIKVIIGSKTLFYKVLKIE